MACGKNCGDNCGCCFEDGVATTTHQAGNCTVFDVVISSDPCNTVSLGSDGGLLVKECAGVFEDSLCDDTTDPATPFVRTTVIACDGTRTIVDTTPDGDPYTVVGNVVCCDSGGGVVPDVVTTLVKDAVTKTATYTNEIGTTTVLNETDFTANSQIIPVPCEGVLPDVRMLRELPVRWDNTTKTYKAYDDGTIYNKMGDLQVVIFNAGLAFDTGAAYTQTNVVRVFNPSNCRSAKFDPQITLSISGNAVSAGTWDLWAYVGYSINAPWAGVPVNGPLPVTMTATAGIGIITTSTCMPVFYGGVIIPPGGYVDVAIRGELRARNTSGGGNTTLLNAIIVKYDLSTDV